MKLNRKQINLLADTVYLQRMRNYLYDSFPEAKNESVDELNGILIELTQRAQLKYGMVLEVDIAPFIVGAWVFGVNFDEEFSIVRNILNNSSLASFEKSEKLWFFIEKASESLGV